MVKRWQRRGGRQAAAAAVDGGENIIEHGERERAKLSVEGARGTNIQISRSADIKTRRRDEGRKEKECPKKSSRMDRERIRTTEERSFTREFAVEAGSPKLRLFPKHEKLEVKTDWIRRERSKAAKRRQSPTPASHSYTGVGKRWLLSRLGNIAWEKRNRLLCFKF
ncbi:predicted protein [Arabidopsis lyrata subsp. lyrata]|uniref:Predicted protein n=1 Tax=Arabidopsis lyrata subsp. lyrata TaxID=81972 RepID=D7KPH8_ARALL|nr:predicted protein [Arabidopsis lyrata subsp. lyrata]